MKIKMNIKALRKERQMSLSILSRKTGISATHINDIENNLKMPSFINAVILAKALNVKMEEIFTIIKY